MSFWKEACKHVLIGAIFNAGDQEVHLQELSLHVAQEEVVVVLLSIQLRHIKYLIPHQELQRPI